MKSTGRFYLIPLVFAVILVLGVTLLLPKPQRIAAALSEEITPPPAADPSAGPPEEAPAPTGEAPAESAPPVTETPPEEAVEAMAAETAPAAETVPPVETPAPVETAPPEEMPPYGSLVRAGGKAWLADGLGGFLSHGAGLFEWDGYTYCFHEDGSVAVGEVVSLEDGDYAFDERGRWLSPLRTALEATATAEKTEQIVLAVDHELSFWEKAEDGSWRRRMDAYCGYGVSGLVLAEERVMGSKTTPIGAFPLTLAFGAGEDPGTAMTYRQITEDSYWSEAEDESFNTWVESETPVPGEHLMDYYQYKYAVNIGFNLEDVVFSRGSAIFLHCKSTDHWHTAGCVSLSEADMLSLLLMLRDGAYMIIVPNAESIGEY